MATNPEPLTVPFNLDGQVVEARPDETILQAARRHGVEIPHLCYADGMRADGNCRACVVEIEGERVLAPSCCRHPADGMVVQSASSRARRSQALVLELLLSDMPDKARTLNCELHLWAERLNVTEPRFRPRHQSALDACIQCTRCLRACREVQANDVIGLAYRGSESKIVFDLDDPMGESSCVACGECVQTCPTGALMPAGGVGLVLPDKSVDSVCPYCGVGCLLRFHVKENRLLRVEGRDGPANHGRLCVKGRFGFDYVHHPERLTVPLVRRPGVRKRADPLVTPAEIHAVFREASWEEALELVAAGLRRIRDAQGARSLAGFGSAKGSNEEAYLFQKLVRTGFGGNNVDHCTRLCHASSVAALLETIGSGAVSNPFEDVRHAEVIIVTGSQTDSNHPVAATFFKNAVRTGAKLVFIDSYRSTMARHASYALQIRPDTDVALLNAMMNVILSEALTDEDFIAERTEGFGALAAHLRPYTPEAMAPICGIPASTIREVARLYATAKSAMIFWGMGISQHTHGTDNARCLISLALMTGQIGRPGTGLHPLRGQNNVQGASDMGLIPMVFPGYRPVGNAEARAHFEALWGTTLDPEPGLTVVEIMHAIHNDRIRGMYIMGENPAMSDPDLGHARSALAKLEHLLVQDIFLTETAGFADVVLPASAFPEKTGTFTNTDRRVQLGRTALGPPGQAQQDLWIIQQLAQRLGLNWHYEDARSVYAEIRQAMPELGGITWERLEQLDSVTYPCAQPDDPGQAILFEDAFPTPSGRGRFVPANIRPAAELPDENYPLVFITGRQLEHWHTGAMTRRATTLDAIEPRPVVSVHPDTLHSLGATPGTRLQVESRRGSLTAYARVDAGVQPNVVFMPFCYVEAAANLLTNPELDPFGKIPEFKYCAVRLSAK